MEYLLSVSPKSIEEHFSEALLEAVELGGLGRLKQFLKGTWDLDLDMQAALNLATATESVEMVRLLLAAGADPCLDDHEIIWTALKQNHSEIYRLLISSRKYKLNPVPEIFLIRKLFDLVQGGTECELMLILRNHRTVDLNYGDGALFNMVCRTGNLMIAKAFLKRGAKVTKISYEIAAEIGSQSLFNLLISRDRSDFFEKFRMSESTAVVEDGRKIIDMFSTFFIAFFDRFLKTASAALACAAVDGDLMVFDDLANLGADIHHDDDAALSMAMEKGCLKMAAELVKRGADATAAASKETLQITDDIFVFLSEHARLEKLWEAKLSILEPSHDSLRKALLVCGTKGDLANLKVILDLWKPKHFVPDDIQDLLDMKNVPRREEMLELLLRHTIVDNNM